ncbi:MAG: cation diffusion facilitator family transporter [Thermoleophilia bacterium]
MLILVLVANFAVALAKGLVGMRVDSISMVADAFHSLMDGSSNIIGLIGVTLATRPRDETHLYGHAKFETFASIGIVVLLLVTAVQIVESVISRVGGELVPPDASPIAFATMGATMMVNIFISVYERRQGARLSSTFLVADSRHTMSDVYVSFSVIASLVAAYFGLAIVDIIVGGIIAGAIVVAARRIMKDASTVLLDRAALDPQSVSDVCLDVNEPGIIGCHKIRTRGSESGYWIDLHLLVEAEMPTRESHRIASVVERRLKDEYGDGTDVVIHIEPGSLRSQEAR